MARGKSGGSDAVSLALRIATVALSVASAAMMASANESSGGGGGCAPAGDTSASYSDYNSFKYALAANLVSAALQAAAALLTARGRRNDGKAAKSLAELVDTASQMFLYSSSGLSLAVDDFGTCGGRGGGGRRVGGVCRCAGVFCRRVRSAGAVSLAAAVALSLSQYLKDVPVTVSFDDGDERKAKPACGRGCHCHH